ncbi:MAG TPA: hypothetical protein VH482_36900 [Thermomicrobiales bacterium]|jgi:hypothetical protein
MAQRSRTRIDPKTFLKDDREAIERMLPPALAPIASAVLASRAMLDLPDDWDGEGSPGYREGTWLRAVEFAVGNALGFWEEYGVAVPAPKLRKGPVGSVDLHWRGTDRELLVNIPSEETAAADYYGDDLAGGHVAKGTLDPTEDNFWLLMWLTKM